MSNADQSSKNTTADHADPSIKILMYMAEENVGAPVTILANGQTISGNLVSSRVFFDHIAKQAAEAADNKVDPEDLKRSLLRPLYEGPSEGYIHLKYVRIFQVNSYANMPSESIFRINIRSIAGWTWGIME